MKALEDLKKLLEIFGPEEKYLLQKWIARYTAEIGVRQVIRRADLMRVPDMDTLMQHKVNEAAREIAKQLLPFAVLERRGDEQSGFELKYRLFLISPNGEDLDERFRLPIPKQ